MVQDKDKRLQRTIDMFRERSTQLRDIVCRLTGWMVDLEWSKPPAPPTVDIKLSSHYAASAAEVFNVRYNVETQKLALLRAADAVNKDNFAYLTVSKSYPAFFAKCLMDGFDSSTSTAGGT